MRKVWLWGLFVLVVFLVSGCSVQPLRLVRAESDSLKDRTDIPAIDPNDGPYSVRAGSAGPFPPSAWTIEGSITQDKPCRVKYNRRYYGAVRLVAVDGRIGKGGKKYPVLLDTGSAQSDILVNDIHVLENKLAIIVFDLQIPRSIEQVIAGKSIGTLVTSE